MDADCFKQLFTPRKPGGTWSASNKERVGKLIASGLMRPAGIAAVDAAKADGSWSSLDDVEALVVPPDLAEALSANAEARRGFDSLSTSARKMLLFWIGTAKRADTRAKRSPRRSRGKDGQGRDPQQYRLFRAPTSTRHSGRDMSRTALDLVAARIIDPVSYARPGASVADALRELRSRRTPALPVIDSGRQIGSVSGGDARGPGVGGRARCACAT